MNQYPPSGPRRPVDDDDDDRRGGQGESNRPGWSGSERQFNYQPEERYWTDYLRIAAPVLGVILILGLAWFWINQLLSDDNGNGNGPSAAGTPTLPVIVTPGSPTVAGPSGTPSRTATPPAGTATGTQTARPTTIGPGAMVVVANTDGEGVNMREEPSTSASIVATLAEGTELEVVGEAQEADGYTWWQVMNDEFEGWIAEDFLELAE